MFGSSQGVVNIQRKKMSVPKLQWSRVVHVQRCSSAERNQVIDRISRLRCYKTCSSWTKEPTAQKMKHCEPQEDLRSNSERTRTRTEEKIASIY